MPLKEVGLSPGHIVLDGTQPPTAAPPHFWPMPIVAQRSPISATADLLFSSTYSNSSNTTVSDIAYEKYSVVTSKQSFFLCVIAPQFSHAPFRYFVAREVCISHKIITKKIICV